MEEEVVEPGSATAARDGVPTEGEPPRRPRRRSNANLYSPWACSPRSCPPGSTSSCSCGPRSNGPSRRSRASPLLEGEVKVKPTATQQWKPGRERHDPAGPRRGADGAPGGGGADLQDRQRRAPPPRQRGPHRRYRRHLARRPGGCSAGQVNFELTQNTEIATPTATTKTRPTPRATSAWWTAGCTGIKIFKGSAQVATVSGDKITLKENEAVKVDAKGKAGRKSVLPTPPLTVAPPAAGRARIQEGARHHDAASSGSRCREAPPIAWPWTTTWSRPNLLLSAALDQPGIPAATTTLQGLDPGKYYWRVAGVNEEGVEGKYSKVSNFAVVPAAGTRRRPRRQPRPTLEPLEVMGSVVALRGRAAPGSTVTVDGIEIRVGARRLVQRVPEEGRPPRGDDQGHRARRRGHGGDAAASPRRPRPPRAMARERWF